MERESEPRIKPDFQTMDKGQGTQKNAKTIPGPIHCVSPDSVYQKAKSKIVMGAMLLLEVDGRQEGRCTTQEAWTIAKGPKIRGS